MIRQLLLEGDVSDFLATKECVGPPEVQVGSAMAQVSVACRDLLKGMLTAEPTQRISIQGIMSHPWFLKDLPLGTLQMNARLQDSDNCRYLTIVTKNAGSLFGWTW